MTGWIFDFRQTLHRLARRPAFTAIATGTLGVAVAGCAVVLAFGWATLIEPVSLYPDRDRLIDLQSTRGRGPTDRFGVTPADFLAWRSAQTCFESLGAYVPIGEIDLAADPDLGGEPLRLRSHVASAGVFDALGVPPALGRTLVAADEAPGSDHVAVLSDHLWRRLGADTGLVGETLRLGGEPYQVIGVMPPGLGLRGDVPDLWLPLVFGPDRPADRRTGTLVVLGRLRPGVGLVRARAEMDAIGASLASEHQNTNRDLRPSLLPLVPLLTKQVRPVALLLLGAVAAVLAVATVNLGNLLLVSSLGRAGEMSIRSSLGAGPARLARQILLEGVALAMLAATIGTVLAAAALRALPDLQGKFLFRSVELQLGPPVLALTALLAFLAAGLATLVPALGAARAASSAPRPAAKLTADRRSAWLGRVLVVGQIAATLALLAGAGLLVRSLVERLGTDLGYGAASVLSFEVAPPPDRYSGDEDLVRFSDALRADLASLPGVEAAASSDDLPGSGWPVSVWSDELEATDAEPARLVLHLVTPDYFAVLGVSLLAGRSMGEEDVGGAPPVAVLDRTAARLLFGDQTPIGRSVAVDGRNDRHLVIGVAPDLRLDPASPPEAGVYLAYRQHATLLDVVEQRRRLVLVRTSIEPASVAHSAAAAVRRLDPEMPVSALQPLAARITDRSFRPRLATQLLSAFALLALGLAAVGLYALSAEGASRRRREVGIRVALGADRAEIVRLFSLPAAAMVTAGIGAGLALAAALGRAMRSLLFGVQPYDPLSLAAASALLVLAMALAIVPPIRRALRVHPREALAE